jgi:hypothetical protein
MSRTLPAARDAFVAAMKRETSGAELTRLVAVLDALIDWSTKRPQTLSFHNDDGSSGVLAFECVGSKAVCWSARVTRGDAPKLEIYPPTGRSLSAEDRARVIEILNSYSRQALSEKDRLRIGFGALKNGAAFEAITSVLGEVLMHNSNANAPVRVAS